MSRTILSLTGSDAQDFLQNLVTNDVARVDDGLVYAALLTPQGKFIADFFLKAEGEAILLDVASTHAPDLLRRLSLYRLRAKVEITESPLQVSTGTGEPPKGALPDPRHAALGWRLYGDRAGDDPTDRDALRVEHLIPETGIELTPDSYILEMGFERLKGVDFRKGCYVGQEVTARMKHKTSLRKGLARVTLDGAAPAGAAISADGKAVGSLFTQSGNRALAYLRLDRATGTMLAGDATVELDATA